MDTAQLIQSLTVQAPIAAVLLLALNTVYQDWKQDREQARQERQALIDKMEVNAQKLDDILARIAVLESKVGVK